MAPKRKSDTIDLPEIAVLAESSISNKQSSDEVEAPAPKKARVSKESDASTSKGKKAKESVPTKWQDVVLEGEEEDNVPIYDDCNDIRRKINALLKTPGFKITPWLKEIGNINSNSYRRFMKASGPTGGAENGTYPAAYQYFEKVRIAEGKKKTPKRIKNEEQNYGGFSLQDMGRRGVWVIGRR